MALSATPPPFVNRDRRFHFERVEDVSGVSGTGVVATGILFADGQAIVRWIVGDKPQSTVLYSSLHDAEAIHGHDGKTRLVFDDDYDPSTPAFQEGRRGALLEARDVARRLSRGGISGQVQHAYSADVAGAIEGLLR
ncbi:MAG: hypothetical protein K2X91_08435 [Thermoleophilia bacterium]|nr:hypothetical protein [Thermoleophilia bacterium]